MILIDSNSLVVLIVGLMDKKLISTHKRTSIYSEEDFEKLLRVIQSFDRLLILPNTWTEVDNLLNNFSGNYKWPYIQNMRQMGNIATEKYLKTQLGIRSDYFIELGLTDSLILELGKQCEFLITSDSALSDFAIANNIKVYDMVAERNKSFQNINSL